MQFGDFCVLNTLLLAQINFRMCFVYFLEGHLFKTFWYGDVFRQKITFFYPLIEFLRENLATRKQNLGKWTCFIKSSVLYLNHRTFLGWELRIQVKKAKSRADKSRSQMRYKKSSDHSNKSSFVKDSYKIEKNKYCLCFKS